ncbi:MAG TPA: hypothetical protein PLF84_17065 [Bryobacteraceae bacterium]|nr:hypothetical protein [Bryobacterales bacterium]HRJ20763.1 hypothetical protein [Bryobacteraceae bacterium]
MNRTLPFCLFFAALASAQSITVPPFPAESREFFTTAQGLPSNDIRSIAVTTAGAVFAATPAGLARLDNNRWTAAAPEPVLHLASAGDQVFYTTDTALHRLGQGQIAPLSQPEALAAANNRVWAAAAGKIIEIAGAQVREHPSPGLVRQIALSPSGRIVLATQNGVFELENSIWKRILANDWSLNDARAAAFDAQNTLWIATPACVANQTADGHWRTFTGRNGLPYNDFTFAAATREPWFTTRLGAIRFDGHDFRYRQGLRYLPSDDVRAVALAPNGDAWFATAAGVGVIRRKTVTLAEKARYFEDEIDKYHRRTPFEYILEVALAAPGDKSKITQHDSDNDGLWTAMYGAGECFAWAATKDPKARARATKAFEALRFLGNVTQGGPNPAPPGFVARTILPTSGPDPNATHYTPERDAERRRTVDSKWKIISPRWPKSADGQWFWKSDTSSDELDGHYFLNGLYFDLVAESPEEKQRVRDQVTAMTDHLISHGFKYIDHDGQPTRWGYFDPESLNFDSTWFEERGLNSLSMLTYLRIAHHITGHDRYQQAFQRLVREHGYAMNLMVPKIQSGPGAGNQSDDEMAFMNYYHLLKYEKDPKIRQMVALSLHRYWQLEAPEMNPFFNFVAAFALKGATYTDAYGTNPMDLPGAEWLDDSVETLRRIPLDRVNWSYRNSHRLDITPLEDHKRENGGKGAGHRPNGKVIPYDEQFVQHWNHDPWRLDFNGQGRTLATGAVYLLPYYMGLYHGFIRE